MFEDAKEGDKVWDSRWGLGVVVENRGEGIYPLTVSFGDNRFTYAYDGRVFTGHQSPALFWKEQQFDLSKPEPRFYWVLGTGTKSMISLNHMKRTEAEAEEERARRGFEWKVPIEMTRE